MISVKIMTLRKIVSLTLFISALIVFVTGVIMYLESTKTLYRIVEFVPADKICMLHTYSGFIASGLGIIHIYLNWAALRSYLRSLFK